ncbi:uncharacterized protein EV420DRAFT_1639406 [Desarmillaria tabescens]|uniref:Uncharacterized protein n=1 Tax=Armillaria tabescens TaxID=1929756 RepID=A0AA39ND16_ARMTA|nr:uncharacterized protein EV420DRAFT_1639406 [Desarmillaria tabescens]KAK0463253.1 hypothetical protein EV420DRAFT_1639406 [Desarmillaria tabescens]
MPQPSVPEDDHVFSQPDMEGQNDSRGEEVGPPLQEENPGRHSISPNNDRDSPGEQLHKEESSPTEAMKYASQVQHQEQSKESGYDQMPGVMWEVAAAAQIVQTPEVPGQQTSIASGPGESPSWQEAAQQWKASRYIPDPPIQPDPREREQWAEEECRAPARNTITIADLRAWADTFGEPTTARISPVESTSSIGGTLDTITEEENPIPLTLPRSSGAQTPYYPNDEDPWGEQTDTNELLEQHPHADSLLWERRVLFADTNEEDTVLWRVSQIGLTAGAGSANDYGTWPEPDITKLAPTQSSKPSLPPNQPSTSTHHSYPKESYSGGPTIEQTSKTYSKDIEDTSHISGTGTRYGSMEIPTSYNTNPSSIQLIISTDWTHGLEPGYKSTSSPVRENMPMNPPSMRGTMSLFRGPAPIPTEEELYRMNWDQFWWNMHDQLPHETYWSTTPQGQAYQQAEPSSQLQRDILSQETQYIAINYWNILHPDLTTTPRRPL